MSKLQPAAPENIRFAILAIVTAVFFQSLGDATVKAFNLSFSLWQIYVLRSLPAILFIWMLGRATRVSLTLEGPAFRWGVVRGLLLALMWVAFASALPHVKLSLAAAGFYTLPLWVTIFSQIMLRDTVPPLGWFAVCVGFTGVLLVLRPSSEAVNAYALLPLLSAMLTALAALLTRAKLSNVPTLALTQYVNYVYLLVGIAGTALLAWLRSAGVDPAMDPFVLGPWIVPGGAEIALVVFLAATFVIFSSGVAAAYQSGSPPLVATFDYAYIPFSILWGFLFFRDGLDFLTGMGIVLIAAGGAAAVWSRRHAPSIPLRLGDDAFQ